MSAIKHQTPYTGTQIDLALRKSLSRKVGSLYVSGNATPTAVASTQTYYPITVTSVTLANSDFVAANSRLTLTADITGTFLIMANLCLSGPSSNEEVRARIGKNGATLPQTCSHWSITGNPSSGRVISGSLHTVLTLEEDDYVELFIGNWTNADDLTAINLQLTAIEL